MAAIFPSEEWLRGLEEKLNSDPKYNEIGKNWEGDLFFFKEPEGNHKERHTFYLDLWHGTCRKVEYAPATDSHPSPTFILTASYKDITAILRNRQRTPWRMRGPASTNGRMNTRTGSGMRVRTHMLAGGSYTTTRVRPRYPNSASKARRASAHRTSS